MTTANNGRVETTAADQARVISDLGFVQYDVKLTARGYVLWGYCGKRHTMIVVNG